MSRPSSRLNFWSVPPSSTSARTATESYPWSSGYRSSSIDTGSPACSRLEKSSRSSSCAAVVVPSSRNSSAVRMSSHSLLRLTSSRSGSVSRILPACCWKVAALASISSSVSTGRSVVRPDGSPTRAV